jgi:CheY-like chemotaxis protein
MTPKVLIVDDDQAWLRLIQAELEEYTNSFVVIVADGGDAALDILKNNHISLVVSDLRMPGMDGFDLLATILNVYPDIPVFIVTAYDKPKTREVVFKSGAAGYLKKPFSGDELAEEIINTLQKKAEGGNLHNVSLDTFLQLIEMEQQTCTLRIINKKKDKGGVIFFRDGDIMNARIGDQQGKAAAYEILSWSRVSLSIEHECVFHDKKIDGDLQAILLDSMRSKDEGKDKKRKAESPESEILLDAPIAAKASQEAEKKSQQVKESASKIKQKASAILKVKATKKEPDFSKMSPVEKVRHKIQTELGSRNGLMDIYLDQTWEGLLYRALDIGETFSGGRLNVLYVNKGSNGQFIVVPGEETAVVKIDANSPRDRIIDILSE